MVMSIIALAVFCIAIPINGNAQTSVPVKDEENISVNEDIRDAVQNEVEISEQIKRYNEQVLTKISSLVKKEYELDPQEHSTAIELKANNAERRLENVRTGYKGYLNGKYLDGGAGEDSYAEQDYQQHMENVEKSEFRRYLDQHYGYDHKSGEFEGDADSRADKRRREIAKALKRNSTESPRPEPDIDEITGGEEETEQFFGGDFSKGGFEAWFSLSGNPDNTPSGAYLKAQRRVGEQVAEAQGAQTQKLNWYDGVHAKTNEEGETLTPGSVIEDKMSRAVDFCNEGMDDIDEAGQTTSPLQKMRELCDSVDVRMQSDGTGILSEDFSEAFTITTGNGAAGFEPSQVVDNLIGEVAVDWSSLESCVSGQLLGEIGPILSGIDFGMGDFGIGSDIIGDFGASLSCDDGVITGGVSGGGTPISPSISEGVEIGGAEGVEFTGGE